jgi:enoyl-CoA hydratase/carnithine racemase
MDTTRQIAVERHGAVQLLRFARPEKKNALTDGMYHALADAMAAAEADGGIGAHLFAGSGGVFTAGNDIGDFLSRGVQGEGFAGGVVRFLEAQATAAKPMVAAVDGLAVGIGTTMLLQCDMVLASPAAVLRTPFVDLGILPENASSLLGPRLMGHAWAFELLCAGEAFGAERALAARIVNAIHPAETLEAEALALAARLAAKPREAMRIARALLRGSPEERLERSREEGRLFAERVRSEEARAAFTAFMSRRSG